MKPLYCLGLDVAKHKLRAALCDGAGAILFEHDLPVSAAGRSELLAQLRARVPDPALDRDLRFRFARFFDSAESFW